MQEYTYNYYCPDCDRDYSRLECDHERHQAPCVSCDSEHDAYASNNPTDVIYDEHVEVPHSHKGN